MGLGWNSELPKRDAGGGPVGVNDLAEDGGGPAGVVEGLLEAPKEKRLLDLFSGVDGVGLEEYGTWKVIAPMLLYRAVCAGKFRRMVEFISRSCVSASGN
jgi:hypothetical protein